MTNKERFMALVSGEDDQTLAEIKERMKMREINTLNSATIPYESALKLKELGFDEPCFGKIYADGGIEQLSYLYKNSDEIGKVTSCSAPLSHQAFRFFRDKYELPSWIYTSDNKKFWYSILRDGRFHISDGNKPYETYEEAELACLIKLIEVVKTK